MYAEDYLMFMTFHSESHFDPNRISEPTQTPNEPVFPAELLDSGFEWTEILTAESKH
jgi:hypothetical protein